MTNTATRPRTVQGWLSALRGCLTITHRADGTKFTHLSDASYWAPIREDLESVVYACHDNELPNEWRYSIIDHIVNDLLDRCEPDAEPWDVEDFRDISWDVAESGADSYTFEALQWLAAMSGRVAFRDVDVVDSLPADKRVHLGWLATTRQTEEIEWMVQTLLTKLASL